MDVDRPSPATIDEYIMGFPQDLQKILSRIRETIRRAAPGAEETIKYQVPTFVMGSNLVHFAAFKNHVGFYPTPSAIEHFREELAPYKCAKGSVQFPIDQPMPLDLIRKIVEFRVDEIRRKTATRRKKS